MTLIKIFHNAGKVMVRVPQLWFFSIIVFLTYDLLNIGQAYYSWLGCVLLLVFPLIVLGQAGQIKSIQLHLDNISLSIPQIIRQITRLISPFILLLIVEIVLTLVFAVPLLIVTRLLFNQYIKPNIFAILLSIAGPIADIICTYARCALVISNLPSKNILTIVLRTLRNGSITNVLLVFIFGLLNYFLPILLPIYPGTPVSLAFYIIFRFIVVCGQAAVYTLAYMQFEGTRLAVQPA